MTLSLGPGVSFCFVNEIAIILSLRSGRYSALPPPTTEELRRVCSGGSVSAETLEKLDGAIRAGLFLLSEPNGTPLQPCGATAASRSRVYRQEAQMNSVLMSAVWHRVAATVALSVRRADCVFKSRFEIGVRNTHEMTDDNGIDRVCVAHRAINGSIGRHNRCLPTALGLASHLASRRIQANVIIGVRPSPFSAHAWVQLGDELLNDEPDAVKIFTPIASL